MPTLSKATAEEIAQADEERRNQAAWIALSEAGPYPETEWQFRRWRLDVNRRFQKALARVN